MSQVLQNRGSRVIASGLWKKNILPQNLINYHYLVDPEEQGIWSYNGISSEIEPIIWTLIAWKNENK